MPAEHQVMVVGQIARDIVLQVDSIPAAGSAAPATQRLEMLGGKGANQALGLVQLGLRVSLLSAVGDDPAGEWLLGHAAADGIDTTWVARRPGAKSGLIVSAVGPDGWRYVESLPAQVLVSPGDVALAEPAIRKADTMVIQLQQPGEPWPTSADGRTCGHAARTRTVRDQCPPARPGIPVPWLPQRSDAVAFGTDLEGFCGGEGGFGQRARGGMGPPAAPELFGVGQHASDRDRGQQPCAVAGRQRVASLEVQAEPGPAAPGQCGGLVPVGGGAVRGGGGLPGSARLGLSGVGDSAQACPCLAPAARSRARTSSRTRRARGQASVTEGPARPGYEVKE